MSLRSFLFITALIFGFSVNAKEWLIDVRTADEYWLEHLEGATNIEYQQIVISTRELGIKKDDTVRLYCRSGRRAEIAREALLHEGYKSVENLGSFAQAVSWHNKTTRSVATHQ